MSDDKPRDGKEKEPLPATSATNEAREEKASPAEEPTKTASPETSAPEGAPAKDEKAFASDEKAAASDEKASASSEKSKTGENAPASSDKAPSPDEDADEEEEEDEEDEGEEGDEDAEDAPPAPHAPGVVAKPQEMPRPRPSYAVLFVASIIFFLADVGSKWWVVHHVEPKARDLSDGWHFRLNRVENPGGAWGVLGDQPGYIRLPFFFLISAIALVFVVSLWKKLEPRQRALKWALPLLLGGALGNLLDRVRSQRVVDFFEFTIMKAGRESFRWPTFNVADIWICIGVALMAIDMFTPKKPVPRRVEDDEDEEDRPAKASV